jgi:signal transduction histidine kinase
MWMAEAAEDSARMNPHRSVEHAPARPDSSAGVLGVPGHDSHDQAGDPGAPQGADWSPASRKILLVEDDRSIRDALQGLLEEEGYGITTAENGRQALEMLKSSAVPDLIVLDLRMPVMDGWQFRAAQKNDPSFASIPVIALSADGSAKAEAIDAQAYLRKPVSMDALLDAIVRILGEADRQRLLGRLEEAERFAALGRLAASVGHEINNPLAYVSMNIDLATRQVGHVLATTPTAGEPAETAVTLSELLHECRIGLDRIRDVVKDLQRLTRTSEIRREKFSLNDLLDESLAMARNHLEHRATVRKQYNALPPVMGDRSAMGQVLLNLLLNAAQALPEGRAPDNQVTLRTFTRGGDAVVEIADTGAGISPDLLPHIFDPFFTTKPIGEGTGLGLAVSCRIVADHGGRIEVDSELGRGSVFRVTLPMTDGAYEQPRREPAPDDTPAPHGRILVIDDMPAIGRMITAAFQGIHDVVAVTHASEAFARLAAGETFDVILTDLMMPEFSGRDVLDKLSAEWPHLAANVIFMTGGAFTPESREFLDRASQRVLSKPFSIDELQGVVRAQMLDRLRGRN